MTLNMKKIMLLMLVLLFGGGIINVSAQEAKALSEDDKGEIVTHNVAMGETVMLICKKYLVKPQDIYDLNPTAVNGLAPNSVIRIPVSKSLKQGMKKAQPSGTARTGDVAVKPENGFSVAQRKH
jgi:LysM repeat protein